MEERVETPGHTIIAVTVLLFQSLRQITWRTLSCCKENRHLLMSMNLSYLSVGKVLVSAPSPFPSPLNYIFQLSSLLFHTRKNKIDKK